MDETNLISHSKFLDFKSAKSPAGHDWYYVKRTNDKKTHDSAVVITTLVKKDGEYNFLFLKTKRPHLRRKQSHILHRVTCRLNRRHRQERNPLRVCKKGTFGRSRN